MSDKQGVTNQFLAGLEKAIPRLFVALVLIALFLAFMHHSFWQYGIDKNNIPGSFFDLDSESTVGAWFASIQWFLIALLSFTAYYLESLFDSEKRYRKWWLVVGAAFLVASLDDASIVHETMGELWKPIFAKQGIGDSVWGYFAESPWLVFYTLPLFVFMFFTLWFLSTRFGESRKASYLCATGFALYIVCLIIEFVQGMPPEKLLPIAIKFNTTCPWFYKISVLFEETFENLGSAFIVVALLYYVLALLKENLASSGPIEDAVPHEDTGG